MAGAAQTGPILDPQLAAARFLRDVRPLEEHRLAFEAAGVRLLRLEYPVIEVALLWKAKNSEVILHVEAPDYDYLPPMAWWIDASGAPLREGRGLVPSGQWVPTDRWSSPWPESNLALLPRLARVP